MKKDYIVDLTEEEADELMDEHWVGELVRCKDCKWRGTEACFCKAKDDVKDDWFCSEGEKAVSE